MESLGIRGQSVYTALFHHLDMETFTCKLCAHKDGELEDAITHQRVAHFRHYPYTGTYKILTPFQNLGPVPYQPPDGFKLFVQPLPVE